MNPKLIPWIEEALTYVDDCSRSPSMAREGEDLLAALRSEAALPSAQEPVAELGKGPTGVSFQHLTDAGRALPPGKYNLFTAPPPPEAMLKELREALREVRELWYAEQMNPKHQPWVRRVRLLARIDALLSAKT